VGCDRADDGRSAGQRLRSAVVKADAQSERLAAEVQGSGKKISWEVGQATQGAVDKVKDAAITSAINARLLTDSRLNVMHIDVDTVNGHVALNGSAPDQVSKEHAGALAARVDGVITVDNRLLVVSGKDIDGRA
jgi:hyperosmotically inducible periplasmic protein